MSASNDSFLKLIGMSDTSMIEEKGRVRPLENEPTDGGAAEDTQTEAEFEDEPTELNTATNYTERSGSEANLFAEPVISDESTETSNPLDVFVDEAPEEFAYPTDSDFVDEETRSHTELSNDDRLISMDSPEVENLLQELQQDVSEEDHLLAGIEEAEASRATDIYAKSFRADSRKTRAHGKTNESFVDFENQSTAKTKAPEDPIDISARTLVLSQELDEDSDPKTMKLDLDDGDPSVEDPEAGLDADDLFDTFQKNKPRNSGVSRTTQAFEYQSGTNDLPDAAQFRLIPLAGHSSFDPIAIMSLPYSIGRDPQNNFAIEDNNSSRFHAEIRDVQGQVVIVDLNSTNGIQVNGELVTERGLQSNDEIQIGNLVLRYEAEFVSSAQDLSTANPQETMMMPTRKQGVKKTGMRPRTKRLAILIGLFAIGYLGYQNVGTITGYLGAVLRVMFRASLPPFRKKLWIVLVSH